MAAVLIRRVITQEESLWKVLDNNTKIKVKAQLIDTIKSTGSHATRKKLCDTLSEVAMVIFSQKEEPSKEWPEFIQFLFDCAKSSTHKGKKKTKNKSIPFQSSNIVFYSF